MDSICCLKQSDWAAVPAVEALEVVARAAEVLAKVLVPVVAPAEVAAASEVWAAVAGADLGAARGQGPAAADLGPEESELAPAEAADCAQVRDLAVRADSAEAAAEAV